MPQEVDLYLTSITGVNRSSNSLGQICLKHIILGYVIYIKMEVEKMGYIIPNQPIQSQIYANRMLMDDYNFAYINNVNSVKMKTSFEDHLAKARTRARTDGGKAIIRTKRTIWFTII